jgi:hypothetical protein
MPHVKRARALLQQIKITQKQYKQISTCSRLLRRRANPKARKKATRDARVSWEDKKSDFEELTKKI